MAFAAVASGIFPEALLRPILRTARTRDRCIRRPVDAVLPVAPVAVAVTVAVPVVFAVAVVAMAVPVVVAVAVVAVAIAGVARIAVVVMATVTVGMVVAVVVAPLVAADVGVGVKRIRPYLQSQ